MSTPESTVKQIVKMMDGTRREVTSSFQRMEDSSSYCENRLETAARKRHAQTRATLYAGFAFCGVLLVATEFFEGILARRVEAINVRSADPNPIYRFSGRDILMLGTGPGEFKPFWIAPTVGRDGCLSYEVVRVTGKYDEGGNPVRAGKPIAKFSVEPGCTPK